MVGQLYEKIISIGESSNHTNGENKQLRLLNTYALITMHFTLIMPVADLILGFLSLSAIGSYVFIFINMLLVMFLNKKGRYLIASYVLIVVIMMNIFLFSIVTMPGYYSEYYYAFLSGIALSLFRKVTVPIVVTIISFLLFFVPYYVIVVYSEDVINHLDVAAVLFLFLIFFLLVNYFKKNNLNNEEELKKAFKELEEQKKTELRAEQAKSLKTKINPHFVFNSVNAIQGLVLKGDKHQAYQYLSKFSGIIRDGIKTNEQNFVTIGQELSLLDKYLELEKLRFQNTIEYKVDMINVYESDKIPSILIQPFIEDVMYRLFHSKLDQKRISIQIVKDKKIKVSIKDNGISHFSFEELKKTSGLNDEIQSIAEKIKLFNHCYKTNIDYTIKGEKGKNVTIINIPPI